MALLGSSIGDHLALIASDKLLRYMLIPVLPVVAFFVLRAMINALVISPFLRGLINLISINVVAGVVTSG